MFSLHRKKNQDNISSKMLSYPSQHKINSIQSSVQASNLKNTSNPVSYLPTNPLLTRNEQQNYIRSSSPLHPPPNSYHSTSPTDSSNINNPNINLHKKNLADSNFEQQPQQNYQSESFHETDSNSYNSDRRSVSQTMKYTQQQKQQQQQQQQQNLPQLRRVWVRKNTSSVTTINVGPYDIVDDLKYMISNKFPTTLGRQFDPSDLIIKLRIPQDIRTLNLSSPREMVNTTSNSNSINKKLFFNDGSSSPINTNGQHSKYMQSSLSANELMRSNTPLSADSSQSNKLNSAYSESNDNNNNTQILKFLVLEPDVLVWSILDKYYFNGMSMSDAFIVDVNRSTNNEIFKYDQTSSPNRNLQFMDRQELSTSFDINNNINNYNSISNANNKSLKTAILGDQKVPPPRLRVPINNVYNSSQTPQSSAVILFPKDIRDETKPSNQPQVYDATPPSPTPKLVKNDTLPPIQISKSPQRRTNSSDLHKKLNLKVNTNGSIDTLTDLQKLSINEKPIFDVTPTSDSTIKDLSPDLSSGSKTAKDNELPTSNNKKVLKKEKKFGISKILSHINVLVVEDNLVNQKIMARHLKSCKVQFQIASTGKEALEMWKEGGFHLCFMDIQLPVMSGIEVTKEIRRLERLNHIGNFSSHHIDDEDGFKNSDDILDLSLFRSPIIIVALTASSGAVDQQNALAAGCNDYLTKPVQLKWLKNKLTEWGYMQALINYDYFRNES